MKTQKNQAPGTTSGAEQTRIATAQDANTPWQKWGPYLSERQWGTVREDYSCDGNSWDYFSHDQARSRAYRWGEDGIAGISDNKQHLCFALSMWNGNDPIIKERLFGLTNSEGNHGEDVKEYYYYLDSSPTHSYMKYLYKYPQRAYPYDDIVRTNRSRSRKEPEYELIDTGIFSQDRYYDVFVEYAKAAPEDILIKITVCNRGCEAATLHLLPTLWFRNDWTCKPKHPKPQLAQLQAAKGLTVVKAAHHDLGARFLYVDGDIPLLFTDNETNNERIFGKPNKTPYVKDGINNYLINQQTNAVNPQKSGTKTAAHCILKIEAHSEMVVRLRLNEILPETQKKSGVFGKEFDNIMATRLQETDEFYDTTFPPAAFPAEERRVIRQALAGMLWSKQYYLFDVNTWLEEHQWSPTHSMVGNNMRNRNWFHMENDDIISMPDKWEYPWYAAWDLAFHTLCFNLIDPNFAQGQINLMLSDLYLHPNGQIPAYEWNFGDVNPPVHAWAILFADNLKSHQGKKVDSEEHFEFLKNAFFKLLMNFTWWVNRKDLSGKNVFEGGFLGLDNIGVFDRSNKLPNGGTLEQADGTAWMAFFSLNMLSMSLKLAQNDSYYEEMANKFLEHFFWIAAAMDKVGANYDDDLWDDEDGFFYDVIRLPDGSATRIKVRSMVGILPLCAVSVISDAFIEMFPKFTQKAMHFMERHADHLANIQSPQLRGYANRHLLSAVSESKLRKMLTRILDEERFLSPFGLRSLSRWHKDHPYFFDVKGEKLKVEYLPGESDTGMFGGNSNWRGPIWMPVNCLFIRALLQYYLYYGDSFKIECPTGSGKLMNLFEVAQEMERRLSRLFLPDEQGRRPIHGEAEKFNKDPHWKDNILFYEYFHGDTGKGLGASHQTGWSGTVAVLLYILRTVDMHDFLNCGTNIENRMKE